MHYPNETAYYVQEDNGKIISDTEITPNPRPNIIYKDAKGQNYGGSLGFIPFWRFDYNRKQISGLKPIKALIDDYDLMECGLSNNLQDFDHPIYAIKGYEGDNLNELQHNIKTTKTLGVDENGGIDILTVDVPYEARKTKADEDEKNIYRFGMGLNTQGLKDTSATTNLAIQAAYTLLDLKARKVIKNIKKFLRPIIEVVIDDINSQNGTGYQPSDVYIDFHPEILINETENASNDKVRAETKQIEINIILNVADRIGDEEVLKAICEILEIDFEDVKELLEDKDKLEDAQSKLEEVIPEEGAE